MRHYCGFVFAICTARLFPGGMSNFDNVFLKPGEKTE
jgi:hypothetical protein